MNELQALKEKLYDRIADITGSREPSDSMIAVVSTLELVISDIEELQAQVIVTTPREAFIAFIDLFCGIVQPDYSEMTMSELLDCFSSVTCNWQVSDAISDLITYEIDSVSDDELKRAIDKLTGYIWTSTLCAKMKAALEDRDNARRCPECGQLREVCESNGYWLPSTQYEPGEYVCGYEPDYDRVQDEIPY